MSDEEVSLDCFGGGPIQYFGLDPINPRSSYKVTFNHPCNGSLSLPATRLDYDVHTCLTKYFGTNLKSKLLFTVISFDVQFKVRNKCLMTTFFLPSSGLPS